jgi:hypothetical protein
VKRNLKNELISIAANNRMIDRVFSEFSNDKLSLVPKKKLMLVSQHCL